ncbi:MAG: hypothetical protein AUJ96_06190 [Armatimonadetes bacterium CG2_30_66_41]|nr:hypothetical protein [Armatimonadota bacterium]OIP08474.1 MAG: hypothetical protein AUJ96_06190 [Armatimonadetes bacterium CG2_30_66_41]PIU92707.1 MAG: hypothetical protein COS65_16540 [Armatimonadetes bacterium CG06_land_8_20_14_3_00_66_21]PIX45574.1 MAG: hypothetical protein COZ57_15025 [Armatimonadetes bacterium CG_4_8_14_3_um_filter_66_20]PJB72565.1 MAG: hypothetical protein CO096_07590 [Armatimonadetes bacterium CG_4_9_14_3_um_filter_66_14]
MSVAMVLLVLLWMGVIAAVVVALTSGSAERLMRRRLDGISVLQDEVAAFEESELSQPFAQRTILPFLEKFGDRLGDSADKMRGGQIAEMLEQAGYPWGMSVTQFLGLKLAFVVVFLGIAVVGGPFVVYALGKVPALATMVAKLRLLMTASFFMLPMVGFIFPNMVLGRLIKGRHKRMKKSLPDTVDLLVLSMEAGMGFDGAVGEAVKAIKGPLSDEFARVLAEVAHGKGRSLAFRALASRTKMAELSLLVAAIDQAEKMGVGLASALRAQAAELRERRMMETRERAAKLPVKMMFPLVLFIFPALFVVILGPAVVQMKELMDQGVF